MSYRLTTAEQALLDTEGYVVRRDVFDPGEVARVVGECERLAAEVSASHRGTRHHVGSYTFEADQVADLLVKWEGDSDVLHGLEPFVHLAPPLAELAHDPRFVEPMIDLVGDDSPMLFTEKLNLKRPHHGGRNPLHQDLPYWYDAPDPTRIATAMLHLDDADLENGALEVVPGSHREGRWKNRTDGDVFGNLEIDPSEEARATTVALEVPAGTVVFFGSLLVHRSAPNTSARQRRAVLFSYAPAGGPHMRDLLRAES